jgi:hypothetical protein
MSTTIDSNDKDRAYRRRLAAQGRRQLIADLPEGLIVVIDEIKRRHGLRSRSQVLEQLIERGRQAAQQMT